MTEMRPLILAEAANPEWVSVPLVGCSLSTALAASTKGHIVTQVRNRDAMVRAGLREGDDFTAIDTEAIAKPFYNLGRLLRAGANSWTTELAFQLFPYLYFERRVWKRFGDRISSGQFNLVHRVTPVSPTIPSPIARHCARAGVPFVLGPLNGGVPWPRQFQNLRRKEREWLSYVRVVHRLAPGYKSTRMSASALLTGSVDTLAQVAPSYRGKCVYLPENAVDPRRFPEPSLPSLSLPLQMTFLGRLAPYKGADMLLEAAAPLVKAGSVKIQMVGEGTERQPLESLAHKLELQGGVTFHGWVEHRELHSLLADMHLLGFPSIREFGGGVVLEAMAMGIVPIVVDYAGPGELVTEATGYKVALGTREDIIAGFRSVLESIAQDPAQLESKRQAARQRVMDKFTWEAKAAQIQEVYAWVLGERPDKPDFGMPFP